MNAGKHPDRAHARDVLLFVGRLFPANPAIDAAVTRAHIDASPDETWRRLMSYEEVPHRPPLLLRLFLPSPVSTQDGTKGTGATVACTYSRGDLRPRWLWRPVEKFLAHQLHRHILGGMGARPDGFR